MFVVVLPFIIFLVSDHRVAHSGSVKDCAPDGSTLCCEAFGSKIQNHILFRPEVSSNMCKHAVGTSVRFKGEGIIHKTEMVRNYDQYGKCSLKQFYVFTCLWT